MFRTQKASEACRVPEGSNGVPGIEIDVSHDRSPGGDETSRPDFYVDFVPELHSIWLRMSTFGGRWCFHGKVHVQPYEALPRHLFKISCLRRFATQHNDNSLLKVRCLSKCKDTILSS
jgi:hypothetical protein